MKRSVPVSLLLAIAIAGSASGSAVRDRAGARDGCAATVVSERSILFLVPPKEVVAN